MTLPKIIFYAFFLTMAVGLGVVGCKTRRKSEPKPPQPQVQIDNEVKA